MRSSSSGSRTGLKDEARRAGQLEKLLDDRVDALELMRDHTLEALAEARSSNLRGMNLGERPK